MNLNNVKQSKSVFSKEEYKIREVFSKKSKVNVNDVIKKSFLVKLQTIELN